MSVESSQLEMIEIKPIKESTEDFEALEREILKVLRDVIYFPLLSELQLKRKTLNNSKLGLIDAIMSGQITFGRGKFTGRFSSTISKELKGLGAQWDRKQGCWKIPQSSLPIDVKNAISLSESKFLAKIADIDAKLAKIVPAEIAQNMRIQDIFDTTLFKVKKSFDANIRRITVSPELSKYEREKIIEEHRNNLELAIKDFTDKQIKQLRDDVRESVFKGNRRESMIKDIQKSYSVSKNKAKFLARQETSLLMSKYKEARYLDAGVKYYKWVNVAGSPNHPVRPQHKRLGDASKKGTIFRWDQPPIVSEPGEPIRHKNPGEDYNCVIGSTNIRLNFGVNKIFRRFYSGVLTKMITNNGEILNVTPNHPVLTGRGWVAAKDVQLGDDVFSTEFESAFGVKAKSNDVVISAQDIFNTFFLFGQVSSGLGSESNFHGDGIIDQEINTICVNRELIFDVLVDACQQTIKLILESADSVDFVVGSSKSALLMRSFGAHQSLSSILCELFSIIKTHFAHSDNVSLAAISDIELDILKVTNNSTSRNSIFFGQTKYTLPALIIIDKLLSDLNSIDSNQSASFNFDMTISEDFRQSVGVNAELLSDFVQRDTLRGVKRNAIVDKTFVDFSGHVYNFETPLSWYVANNVIIHNCRCYAIPVIIKEKQK